jgi:DNA-binding transcriptional LysR family regulator
LPPRPSALRDVVDARLAAGGFSADVRFEIDPVTTLKMHAIEGTACTVLPLAALKAERAAGLLRATPIADPPPGWTIEMILPRGRAMDRTTKAVVGVIKEIASNLPADRSLGLLRAPSRERYPLAEKVKGAP